MGGKRDSLLPEARTPLADYLAGFVQWLKERGHSESTVSQYNVICGRFDQYLAAKGIDFACLDDSHLSSFLEQVEPRRRTGRKEAVQLYYRAACRRLLEYLRYRCFILPPQETSDPLPTVVADFLTFLKDHRGLVDETVKEYRRNVTQFLAYAHLQGNPEELRTISIAQIDGFLLDTTGNLKRSSVSFVCTVLRRFLRYLHMRGFLASDLSQEVTGPRIYSLAQLPRAIKWPEVQRILSSVDRDSLKGRRNYAILTLLVYCGLRAGEVAALRLDDLDWRHDTIRVRRSKQDAFDAMPLVPVVGEALIDYIKCRPSSSHPEVFLKVIAPIGPMSGHCITFTARKYLLAAGVEGDLLGAHTLRHSWAAQLLRLGFPLKTIGDALGHTNPQSTFIYTKVATEDLRTVALEITELVS